MVHRGKQKKEQVLSAPLIRSIHKFTRFLPDTLSEAGENQRPVKLCREKKR
jgi:hypothetical protein